MEHKYEKIPLYCQLAVTIEKKIKDGEWKTGTTIPSERELSVLYNMSRITVRNAINELVKQGKLEKVQGKGTFVIGKSILQNLGNVYSFSKEMDKQGKVTLTQLVAKKVIDADAKVSEHLGLNLGDEVVYIERLRCNEDASPIMLEKTYFDVRRYRFILDIDLEHNPLYKSLEEDYGIIINKAIESFMACELNKEEARKLNCKNKQYGLLVKRTAYANDDIVCYSSIVSKGDIFEFSVKLES